MSELIEAPPSRGSEGMLPGKSFVLETFKIVFQAYFDQNNDWC